MTIHLFSPVDSLVSADFIKIEATPRQSFDKITKAAKPLAYKAFSLALPKAWVDAYSMPSWDTSKYFYDAIIEAVKQAAIKARTEKKNGLDLPDRLPDFLASLSVGGRISKDALVSWLAAINPYIVAYVESRPGGDIGTSGKVNKVVELASKAAAPSPMWSDAAWGTMDRLASFLQDLAEESQPGEFPDTSILEAFSKKVASNKPKPTDGDEV